MNLSKALDPRFQKVWDASGATGTIGNRQSNTALLAAHLNQCDDDTKVFETRPPIADYPIGITPRVVAAPPWQLQLRCDAGHFMRKNSFSECPACRAKRKACAGLR